MIVKLTSSVQSCNYWKQERLIVEFTIPANCEDWVELWSNLSAGANPIIATYTAVDGKVIIDLTDYVRAYESTIEYVVLQVYNDNLAHYVEYQLNISVKGLINPASVLIPYHQEQQYDIIIPPLRMIGEVVSGKRIYAENYAASGQLINVSGLATMQSNGRTIEISGDFSLVRVVSGGSTVVLRKYKLIKPLCGVQYAYVRWQSFSGVTRTHIFEVIKPTTAAADNYSLMPEDNEYIEVKGRVDSFTLRLKDLCPYDLWYYSDVITSSNVEISFDGTTYDRVQITTKNITLPDGDTKQNGKLEIGVNWKRYDAVAM